MEGVFFNNLLPINMQLLIVLNDCEALTHKKLHLEIDEKSTLRQLRQMIALELFIDYKFLDIFFIDGREMADFNFDTSLPQLGLNNMDKIIVRHSLAERWLGCQIYFEDVKKASDEHVKSQIADQGLKLLNFLKESNFFLVYSFERQYDKMIQLFAKNTRGQESHSEVTAVKRRRVDTPEIYPAGETHPEHIDRIKHLLFQALDDNDQDAIVTVIDSTHAVASFHCFESYVDSNKPLIIRNVFNPAKVFTLHAVKSCRASVCQVILFESEVRLIAEDERLPQINLPLWGRQYYVLGLPGESRLFHEGTTHRLSYLRGSVTSVYYADEGKALRIVGDSGSRPGFSGGPLINLLYGDLIGFCVGGGPCAENIDSVCEKFEQARFLIATPSAHVKKWEHNECESSPNTSDSL